ncbi:MULTISPECIES: carbamoyltransferase HypF [unclassified Campylobacter]|uniref:carbamoyltransferase HypF n=1 Tax=unclassified Campylobacter TaxID=2593542 RepID=UPI0022E9ECCC|nr:MULTISPECIES: carbamoyltransferase HypF [unclassified Campylobacter]MDA3079868.1 carbamoyltransferase HypF [Campylobacter sp. CS_NA2]MDA3081372.1 carbamoyltransferase HypF [Campylobacter sp. CS_NA1]MDA3085969.1 carbamoyltransferase HypF [Campylobacter sp. CS_ED1]MDA3090702.1 carbamoyltransferase HypF [Campylobacter sp. CS_ED2]WBR50525.1 carbamoyltransferase HypF [Campylobacter sp. CS_NA3]
MQNLATNTDLKSFKFEIFGAVQGVGFRPFVYRICTDLGLFGKVFNDGEGVKIFVNGSNLQIKELKKRLKAELPPLARIDRLEIYEISPRIYNDFKITHSQETQKFNPILPDFAICDDCRREFYDPQNKRYKYPFINCTNCGPRLSIIQNLPYDRSNTTMVKFKMCEFCENEYKNPLNRRYHAEPIACAKCGPKLFLKNKNGEILARGENAVIKLCEILARGEIVAVKGLGGFHIMCDATNENAVLNLRIRKNRPDKPFAVMCKDYEMAEKFAKFCESEKELLNSQIKPIVLVKKSKNSQNFALAYAVAPNLGKVGIFLANTGIHLLIFEYFNRPLIATSANISGEPIIFDEINLRQKLGKVIDFYLDNDRDIVTPSDDSIAFCVKNSQNITQNFTQFLRTSRGLNPQIYKSKFDIKGSFLALGAEMKNQFAIYKDGQIFISPYIGDLKNIATNRRFFELLEIFIKTYDLKFDAVIGDMHPNFLHTKHFENLGFKVAKFQHHYAHLVANLADNDLLGSGKKYLGFSFDGTGYGEDGTIWGGEVLEFDEFGYERVLHFDEFALIGGESSIKNIYKLAISLIFKFDLENEASEFLSKFSKNEISNLKKVASNSPQTSSLGRIFDAFASVICDQRSVSFDGQSGMVLENLFDESKITSESEKRYKFEIINGKISVKNAFLSALKDEPSVAASNFINEIAQTMLKIAKRQNLEVVLSGGVFQNATLLNLVVQKFSASGVKFYLHKSAPTNDSGVAIGQLMAYLSALNKNLKK